MDLIERVMRVMVHLNIGATLGMAGWIVWSGLSLVAPSDHETPAPRGAVPDSHDRAPATDSPTPLLEARTHRVAAALTKA